MLRVLRIILVLLTIFAIPVNRILAQPDEHAQSTQDDHGEAPGLSSHEAEEEFNAGEYIMEHVMDSYDWHITSFGDKHISVPLPIIVYSKEKGLNVFLSSKFQHGHEPYKGFMIAQEGAYEGKVVELDDHGEIIGKPLDLSFTKTAAGAFVSVIVLFFIFISVARLSKRNAGKAPTGLQNLMEPVIIFIRDEVAKPSIGDKNYERFMPFLLSVFFFILFNNLLGLIPIIPFGANVTGNITVTMVLALFTFFLTQISGNKHYWKELFNPDVPTFLKFPIPLMQIVEIAGAFTKPFVLMVRLFANMLAGHMIVTVFVSLIFIFAAIMGAVAGYGVSLVSIVFSVFMIILDILVSFIQAYVFTLLSALYFGIATAEHH